MATPQTDIKTQLTGLSADAFEAFCNDISGMFGVEIASCCQPNCRETVNGLEKRFKKLSAVITVKAKGALQGDFYIVFDKEALFILAGTIVMLPEQRIQSIREIGTVKDAEELYDAVGETGNLLVGAWDRIFNEGLEGHVHFLQTATFLGNPWENPEKNIGVSEAEEVLFFPCAMTVGSFPAFQCGVIFPEVLFQHDVEAPVPAEMPVPKDAEDAPPEKTDTPVENVIDTEIDTEDEQATGGSVSQTIQKMVQSLPILPAEQAQTLLGVCAKDIMRKDVLWGSPDESIQRAMEKMQQADADCLMVGAPGTLQGIITWIDIAEAVSVYLRPMFSKWRRPADDATLQIKSKVMMTHPVRTITPDTSLAVVMEDMCRHHLRCLPVVDGKGHIEGVVTPFDIFTALLKTSGGLSVTDRIPQSTDSVQ